MDELTSYYRVIGLTFAFYIFYTYLVLFIQLGLDHYYNDRFHRRGSWPFFLLGMAFQATFYKLWDTWLDDVYPLNLNTPTPQSPPVLPPEPHLALIEDHIDETKDTDLSPVDDSPSSPSMASESDGDEITPIPSRLTLSHDSSTLSIIATPRTPGLGRPASPKLETVFDSDSDSSSNDSNTKKVEATQETIDEDEVTNPSESLTFTTKPRPALKKAFPIITLESNGNGSTLGISREKEGELVQAGDSTGSHSVKQTIESLEGVKSSAEELIVLVEAVRQTEATLYGLAFPPPANERPNQDNPVRSSPSPSWSGDSDDGTSPRAVFQIPKWGSSSFHSDSNLLDGSDAELPLWDIEIIFKQAPDTLIHYFTRDETPHRTAELTPDDLRHYPQMALSKIVDGIIAGTCCPISDRLDFESHEQITTRPPRDIEHQVVLTTAVIGDFPRTYRTFSINRMNTREIWVLLIAVLNALATHHRTAFDRSDQPIFTALPSGVILPLDLILPSNMRVFKHEGDAFPGINSPKQVVLEFRAHWMDSVIAEQSAIFRMKPTDPEESRLSIYHPLFDAVRGSKKVVLLGWIPTPLIKGNSNRYHPSTPHGFHPYARLRPPSITDSLHSSSSRSSGTGSGDRSLPGSPRRRKLSSGNSPKGKSEREKATKSAHRLSFDFDALSMTSMDSEDDLLKGCEVARVTLKDGRADEETFEGLRVMDAILENFEEDQRKARKERECE